MDKAWRSILTLAIEKTEIPADDEENTNRPLRSSRRRGRAGGTKSPLDWMPSSAEIMENNSESDAFKLAVLVINKQLKRGDWNDKLTELETSTRNNCIEKGVHEVWHRLGKETLLLAQFTHFPVSKAKSQGGKKVDLSVSRVDVFDSLQLNSAIEKLAPLCIGADEQFAIQKIKSQITSGRSIEPTSLLFNLKGGASVISVLLALVSNIDCTKQLKELAKVDKELSSEFEDLYNLINGNVNDWKASINSGKDGLSECRRRFAWLNFTPEVEELSPEEISNGLKILESLPNAQTQLQNLKWVYLLSLANGGESQHAAEVLMSYNLDNSIDIENLYSLVCKLNLPEVESWLRTQIPSLDDGALLYIANNQQSSLDLKNDCLKILQDLDGEAWEESSVLAVEVFARKLELRRLSSILNLDEIAPISYPYETLLTHHLLATNGDNEMWKQSSKSRKLALTSIHSTEAPDYLSAMCESLIMLMEGDPVADSDEEFIRVLGKKGYQALKQARRALNQGGTGIASRTDIDHLSKSIGKAKLSNLESNLLSVLLSTLKLNQATISLQHGDADDEIFNTLNELVIGTEIPTRIIHSIRQLVFDHDIGLEGLVTWFQQNSPLSPWHTVSRAALFAQNHDELNAAREYKRAAESGRFEFEEKMILFRKAIIHLAHAEQWKEAVELLENQPALRTAITKRFQLYLKVSFTAKNQKTNEATQLLKDFVRRTKILKEETLDGELTSKKITFFAEDELDNLRNYPFEHSRKLPSDPFLGRVTAALTSIQRNKKRNRHGYDIRFRNMMIQPSPPLMEIYDIASESADKNPIEGLIYLERAQNSGKFNTSDLKKLFEAERSLFAKHKLQVANSSRRYLKNLALPPLVVVDTNILVDALVDKIAQNLELASEASLDLFEHDNFHKVLRSRADAGRISLWIPSIAKHELIEISKRFKMLRSKFSSSLVRPEILDAILEDKKISKLVDEIINEFNRWRPLDIHLERDSDDDEAKLEIEQFLIDYTETYDGITQMKVARDPKTERNRTKIGGEKYFPEKADRQIMMVCKKLASKSLEGVGSILVATKDSDFTLTARAFEERFGYGIIKNSRMLNNWLN